MKQSTRLEKIYRMALFETNIQIFFCIFLFFCKIFIFFGRTPKDEKLPTDITHTQNISIGTGPMSNDVFFYRAGETFNHIQNEFTDFLPEVVLHPKFLLNCGVFFAADMLGGVLCEAAR